ncbi:MAG TPA: LytTR family DNA-binding domain-containing protein [Flavobacteriaceae bacterium]|nr:LytTR family DNA-binding domain-containing protein [Flavobacteriaceae bacterium]
MNAIIIEDEKPAARRLQRMLEKMGVQVGSTLHSVEEAKVWFQENSQPDLIFLDIQLSDGLSFEIFEDIQLKSAIIFTTAYDEYALQAFKLNSIDYLLKPIDEEELEKSVKKYREFHVQRKDAGKDQPHIDFDEIKKLLVNPIDRIFKKRFTIKIGQHLKIIPVEDIECFFSENRGTYLHTFDNRSYLLESTLDIIDNELDPEIFFRVSRKYIVAMKAISDIVVYSNSRLKLRLKAYNEGEIIVARERVKDFKKWLA